MSRAQELDRFNAALTNWNAPNYIGCRECPPVLEAAWPPAVGSYGSSLANFEAILGPLPARNRAGRYLILLQDPRPSEANFSLAGPDVPPAELKPSQHRYFCLTRFAWNSLSMEQFTGISHPVWPCEETASAFLRTYLRSKHWCYDAFLAYLLWMLAPQDAYITNVAKCHFGDHMAPKATIKTCAAKRLPTELRLFAPTVVLSLTSKVQSARQLSLLTGHDVATPFIRGDHPRARGGVAAKVSRLSDSLVANRASLEAVGVRPEEIRRRWLRDCAKVG